MKDMKELSEASNALAQWFTSQELSAHESAAVCGMFMSAYFMATKDPASMKSWIKALKETAKIRG